MKKISVFCGSGIGNNSMFEEAAFLLGQTLARNKIDIVYGGACVGLMGAVANGALREGGNVIRILPTFLKVKEVAHNGLTQLHWVSNMHERKMLMNELSDGVIALPGGYGTLDELFEMLTWAQLGLHQKPIALLNVGGYFDLLIQFIQHMKEKSFLKIEHQLMLLESQDINDLLSKMRGYVAPNLGKWITKENT